MRAWQHLSATLAREPAVLVSVDSTQGSVPREVGAWMAVTANGLIGTIGGGQLEFDAIAQARAMLAQPAGTPVATRRYALGPSLGQCCGGVVHLRFERLDPGALPTLRDRLAPRDLLPVALFGGGHVGRAIVAQLTRLPAQVHWIDSRDEVFPVGLADTIRCEHSHPVQSAVSDVAPGSHVLVMSFSHAEDLEVVTACLARQRERNDLPFIGLIGSATKWASFRARLLARGHGDAALAQVHCPIGMAGIRGKSPEMIALSVAAQLFQFGAS